MKVLHSSTFEILFIKHNILQIYITAIHGHVLREFVQCLSSFMGCWPVATSFIRILSLPRTFLAFESCSPISIAFEMFLSQQVFEKAYRSLDNMP
jgi:hypothetical protein